MQDRECHPPKFEISTLKLTYINGMTKPTMKCLNHFYYALFLKMAPDYRVATGQYKYSPFHTYHYSHLTYEF